MKRALVNMIALVLLSNAFLALVGLPMAGGQPPANGTWNINAAETVTGGTYDVNNGNIMVRNGGSLILDGVTITINDTNGPQYIVEVQRGGSLTLRNGAVIQSNSVNNYYFFIVRDGANLTITDSFVYDVGDQNANRQNQGLYTASSSVLIDRSTIARGGIGFLSEDASPVITNSSIINNSGWGMFLDGGEPAISYNNISDNGFAGPWWQNWNGINLVDTQATVSHNIIGNNGWNGGNYGYGVYISTSNVSFHNNTIQDNAEWGIVVDNHSSGTIADNTILNNPNGGIYMSDHSDMDVLDNHVWSNGEPALIVTAASTPHIRGNTFNTSNHPAVTVNGFSSPVIEENGIYQWVPGTGSALEVYDNCDVVIKNNIITSEGGLGIDLWHWVSAEIKGNDISSGGTAVAIGDYSQSTVSNNKLVSWNNQGLFVNTVSEVKGARNDITSRQEGIEVAGQSRMTMTDTAVLATNDNGMEIYGQSEASFRGMNITANNNEGLYAAEAVVAILNSSISAPNARDIHLGGSAWNHICQVEAINTTFLTSDTAYDDDNSVLNVSWYVHKLWVEWQNENRVPYANVTISNVQGNAVFNQYADGNGELNWLVVQEYTQNRTRRVDYTRHNFSAEWNSVGGYFGANVNNDLDVRIILNDLVNDPAITIVYPVNGGLYNTSTIDVRGTAFDPESSIDQVDVWPQGLPSVVANGTEDWRANVTLTDGQWTVTVNATNYAGVKEASTVTFNIDTVEPALTITYPELVDILNTPNITVTGHTEIGSVVTVEGVNAPVDAAGNFSLNVSLVEGLNNITVASNDRALNFNVSVLAVTLDTVPPTLSVSNPPGEVVVVQTPIFTAGLVEAEANLTINGVGVAHAGEHFTASVDLQEGTNYLVFVATDVAGNPTTINRTVIFDSLPPVITVTNPPEEYLTNISSLNVSGNADDRALTTVTVNGQTFIGDSAKNFSAIVGLTEGKNYIVIDVRDRAGHITTVKRTVTLDTTAPPLVVYTPDDNLLTNKPRLRVTGVTELGASVTVGGNATAIDGRGSFDFEYQLVEGQNTVTVRATDRAGNPTVEVRNVRLDTVPPALKVSSPKSGSSQGEFAVEVTGTTEVGATLTINGKELKNSNGKFTVNVALINGENKLVVVAKDAAGNIATREIKVTRAGLTGMDTGLLVMGIMLLVVGFAVAWLMLRKKGGAAPSGASMGEAPAKPSHTDEEAPEEKDEPEPETEKEPAKEPEEPAKEPLRDENHVEKAPVPPKTEPVAQQEPAKPTVDNVEKTAPAPEPAKGTVVSMAHEGEAKAGEHEVTRNSKPVEAKKEPAPTAPAKSEPKKPEGKTAEQEVGPGKDDTEDISAIMARLKTA